MHDDLIINPDLTLILGPEDEAHFLCPAAGVGQGAYWAVIHRRHGAWTHLYRIAQDRFSQRLLVHLVAYLEGECLEEARNALLPLRSSR
jgi:hypothetical protein